ncbi:MAG TPA: T9SS type A sorting domain-containing protein [Longimicrobiaceae bacterium]|nr:T9SS type A sorting domain-containing protein [Longimicrobiaceae bacterium]
MLRARSVLLILFLLAGSLSPPAARGQAPPPIPQEPALGFRLEQNYPNPVNPETWIPFTLDDTLFTARDSVVVTMRIFNILRQVVAIPQALDYPPGDRSPLIGLAYRDSGRKVAYWNGKDSAGRRVPSGVYYCQLVVDDRPQTRKIIVLNPRRRRSIIPWFGGGKNDRSPQ